MPPEEPPALPEESPGLDSQPQVEELPPPEPASPKPLDKPPATAIGAAYELGQVASDVNDLKQEVASIKASLDGHLVGHDDRTRFLVDDEIVQIASSNLEKTDEPPENQKPTRVWERALGGR